MDDVKVIATRFTDRPKTDPNARVFKIEDHIKIGEAYNRSSRLYVGDDFRATLITLSPGQAQETHKHPETSHAWFIVSGKGEVEMEGGKRVPIEPGWFSVHPRDRYTGSTTRAARTSPTSPFRSENNHDGPKRFPRRLRHHPDAVEARRRALGRGRHRRSRRDGTGHQQAHRRRRPWPHRARHDRR